MAIVVLLYYGLPHRWQWAVLLSASYLFYVMVDYRYIAFLLSTTVTVYITTIWLTKKNQEIKQISIEINADNREQLKKKMAKLQVYSKRGLIVCLLVNLAILAILKYVNFVLGNIGAIFSFVGVETESMYLELLLPLGISFYTFQAIGYLLDVYWKRVEVERHFGKVALFLTFFPQLGQGPISRFGDLSKTLYAEHAFDREQFWFGVQRILWGYFKKLVIADRIIVAVQAIVQDPEYYSGVYMFLGMLFYAVELYADFSGGIDITIGVAQLFGVKLTENFKRPFFSKSIKEYWRRWHITMGTWFRDYVFYPFSISKPLKKLTVFVKKRFGVKASKRVAVYVATIILWIATGIWHGADWNYVMWGLLNGIIILMSEELEPLYSKFHAKFPMFSKAGWYRAFQIIRTFLLMSCLRIFDNYSCAEAFASLGRMFTEWNSLPVSIEELTELGLEMTDYIIVAVGVCVMFAVSMRQRHGSVRVQIEKRSYIVRYVMYTVLFFAIVLFGIYGIGYEKSVFIYNQF